MIIDSQSEVPDPPVLQFPHYLHYLHSVRCIKIHFHLISLYHSQIGRGVVNRIGLNKNKYGRPYHSTFCGWPTPCPPDGQPGVGHPQGKSCLLVTLLDLPFQQPTPDWLLGLLGVGCLHDIWLGAG